MSTGRLRPLAPIRKNPLPPGEVDRAAIVQLLVGRDPEPLENFARRGLLPRLRRRSPCRDLRCMGGLRVSRFHLIRRSRPRKVAAFFDKRRRRPDRSRGDQSFSTALATLGRLSSQEWIFLKEAFELPDDSRSIGIRHERFVCERDKAQHAEVDREPSAAVVADALLQNTEGNTLSRRSIARHTTASAHNWRVSEDTPAVRFLRRRDLPDLSSISRRAVASAPALDRGAGP